MSPPRAPRAQGPTQPATSGCSVGARSPSQGLGNREPAVIESAAAYTSRAGGGKPPPNRDWSVPFNWVRMPPLRAGERFGGEVSLPVRVAAILAMQFSRRQRLRGRTGAHRLAVELDAQARASRRQ